MLAKPCRHSFTAFLVVACTALSAPAFAGNAIAGKQKSITCMVCHGQQGKSTNPLYPKLAGQHAKYVVKQLKAFKSGARKDAVMKEITTGLSDADMEDIASFFESVK